MSAFSMTSIVFISLSHAGQSNECVSQYYSQAKMKCQDIPCIRKEMDRINDHILLLLAERTAFALRAGDLKLAAARKAGLKLSQTRADDEKRRKQQAENIEKRSYELGLPSSLSRPVFEEIMINTVRFQQDYIDRQIRSPKD